MKTVVERLDRIPPWLCRTLARKDRGRRLMTNEDIAMRAGLAKSTICKISQLRTWRTVPAGTIDRFSFGCGVNLLCIENERRFLRKAKRAYYKSTSPSQRRMLGKFLTDFAGSHRNYAAASA